MEEGREGEREVELGMEEGREGEGEGLEVEEEASGMRPDTNSCRIWNLQLRSLFSFFNTHNLQEAEETKYCLPNLPLQILHVRLAGAILGRSEGESN